MKNQLPTLPEEIVLKSAEVCSAEVSVTDLPPAPESDSVSFRILFGF